MPQATLTGCAAGKQLNTLFSQPETLQGDGSERPPPGHTQNATVDGLRCCLESPVTTKTPSESGLSGLRKCAAFRRIHFVGNRGAACAASPRCC